MSGRVRQKNKSETEYLKGEVKRLTAANKRLRRENRDLRKREHMYENVVDAAIKETGGDVATELCEKCGKGERFVVDLKFVEYSVCNVCDDRKKL